MARRKPAPRAAEIVAAAQRADLRALQRLHARGADLDASWRNYRPLHALIQGERSRPAKCACLSVA